MTPQTTTISIDFDKNTFELISNFSTKNNLSINELIKTSLLKSISNQSQINLKKSKFKKFFVNYKAKNNIFQNMTNQEMDNYISTAKLSDYDHQ